MAQKPDEGVVRSLQVKLPGQEHNAIRRSWPSIGCWFWNAEEFQPDGYKRFIDLNRDHSPFALLTTSIRHPVEVTDPAVHDQLKRAAEYAQSQGMRMVMDLDVRLARQAFQDAYPDELQEMARLREVGLKTSGEVILSIEPVELGDHYTFNAPSYHTVSSRLLRVYAYQKGPEGIDPDTISEITDRCRLQQADAKGVAVAIACDGGDEGKTACVMAAFSLFTPDVFAPHLAEFEAGILRQYADVPLAGACKDEWGFPGRFEIKREDLWFSRSMAEAYAERRPGHDLVRDLLLMAEGEKGREGDRAAAINHLMEMNWQRNSELECQFYAAIKDVFGPEAMSATHPTWFPFPGEQEAFKNGLDWWACRRDLAQTDETTPLSVRTALSKRWQSPFWVNMFYNSSRDAYDKELWSSVLAGGRINFHPVYPGPPEQRTTSLLSGNLLRADCRIRLLNYGVTAPLDCPVAILFGHPCALNWAGPAPWDVGLAVSDELWRVGHYADLIPTSEIASGPLALAEDGRIQYGPQRYDAAVLFHPQFERPRMADFFRRAAQAGRTALVRIGDWTMDFEGNAFDGNAALPSAMRSADAATCVQEIIDRLNAAGIAPQTPCIKRASTGFPEIMLPHLSGQCRLLDGTLILASGENDVMGDPILKTVTVQGREVSFDAVGIAAVRLDADGQVEAMAAGGLKRFAGPDLSMDLPERIDVAVWRDAQGKWRGVLQGFEGDVPDALERITSDWTRVSLPVPYVP